MENTQAEIGVFGGSGFYGLLEDVVRIEVETPYGKPSAPMSIGEIEGRKVAFLPRHGEKHQYPPHVINYRANISAMEQIGVRQIIAPCAAGSLHPQVKPGDFVICDQFADRTKGRIDTFYDGPETTHISSADPYCQTLREIALNSARELNISVHDHGTVVIIQGPRFSTKAESRSYQREGWEVINMTQYPECILARERELCYVNISLITDYDNGLEGHPDIAPVSLQEVVEIFNRNNEKLKELLFAMIPKMPVERSCACASALTGARF